MFRLITSLLITSISSAAQDTATLRPVVGRALQDFEFADVAHFKSSKVRISDFRGRWLVLDLWNRYCSGCLAKMPLVDSMQRENPRHVTFMLVGYTGSQYSNIHPPDTAAVKKLYERVRKLNKLQLPAAFDSTLFHRFNVGPCPYIVVIDPGGIVRGVTSSLDRQELKGLMEGRQVTLRRVMDRDEVMQWNREQFKKQELRRKAYKEKLDTGTLRPVVGQVIRDFTFEDVQHMDKAKVSLSDFQGRWLVLDFWNRFCGVCLKKMPLLDSMRREFRNQASFLLVGYTGSSYRRGYPPDNVEIRKLYAGVRKRRQLQLPIAYDSTLFHRFNIGPCPYIVVIDPGGRVRGVTRSLNRDELAALISGRPVVLQPRQLDRDEIREWNRQQERMQRKASHSGDHSADTNTQNK